MALSINKAAVTAREPFAGVRFDGMVRRATHTGGGVYAAAKHTLAACCSNRFYRHEHLLEFSAASLVDVYGDIGGDSGVRAQQR